MGGCRCAFRGCKVSTSRNPGMHFFHFPKQGKILEEWIRYSGFEDYVKLPEPQKRNKVICGRHFKDTCFMNYRHNRLVPTAFPTLTRLSPDYALDYESDLVSPKLIKMYPPSATHLIAPAEFPDPLVFNMDDLNYCAKVVNMRMRKNSFDTAEREESIPKRNKVNLNIPYMDELYDNLKQEYIVELSDKTQLQTTSLDSTINSSNEEKQIALNCIIEQTAKEENSMEIESLKEQLVLEQSRYQALEEEKNKRIKELELILACKIDELNEMKTKLSETEAKASASIRKEKERNELFNQLQQNLNAQSSKYEALKQEQDQLNKVNDERLANKTFEITALELKLQETEAEVIELKSQNKESNEQFNKVKKQLNYKLLEINNKYNKLMQEHEELQNQKLTLENVLLQEEGSPTKLRTKETQLQSAPPQQLTKLQLFNGIKRYLSSTMTAILRMQLSSTSVERSWRPDEKRVALDLFSLGEEIYKYFTDEWLIRLPPIREVHNWHVHTEPDDEDDL